MHECNIFAVWMSVTLVLCTRIPDHIYLAMCYSFITRDRPIMLIILPIMLRCSAHKIYLLCSRIRIVLSLLSLFIYTFA